MTTPPDTARGVLENAITAIQEHGHCRETALEKETGSLCLLGALNLAAGLSYIASRESITGEVYYDLCPTVVNTVERAVAVKPMEEAIMLLSKTLPANICYTQKADPGPEMYVLAGPGTDPGDRVIAWNDHVCDGAEGAILQLKRALEAAS